MEEQKQHLDERGLGVGFVTLRDLLMNVLLFSLNGLGSTGRKNLRGDFL